MRKLSCLSMILYLMFVACEKSTSPISNTSGPRNFYWTVDTLAYPQSSQTIMNDIWGSSSSNVYIVGHNARSSAGTMYRFDGKSWKTTGFHIAEGGNIRGPVDLTEIFGFSANNIVAVGEKIDYNPNPPPYFVDSSMIIHFNGTEWNEIPIERGEGLETVWGSSVNDIWAGGKMGSLYHYNGNTWQKDSLDYPFPPYRFLNIQSITGNSADHIYMMVYIDLVENFGYYYLFQYQNDKWIARDSTRYVIDSYTRLWMSPAGKLYAGGNAFRMWDGSSWSVILDRTSVIGLYGLSDDNIYLAVKTYSGGVIYHYNGNDLKELEETLMPGVMFTNIWTDGREIFVVGRTIGAGFPDKTIVLHGK